MDYWIINFKNVFRFLQKPYFQIVVFINYSSKNCTSRNCKRFFCYCDGQGKEIACIEPWVILCITPLLVFVSDVRCPRWKWITGVARGEHKLAQRRPSRLKDWPALCVRTNPPVCYASSNKWQPLRIQIQTQIQRRPSRLKDWPALCIRTNPPVCYASSNKWQPFKYINTNIMIQIQI